MTSPLALILPIVMAFAAGFFLPVVLNLVFG